MTDVCRVNDWEAVQPGRAPVMTFLDSRCLDRAMGLELEANDLEDQLEWAEEQGRIEDAERLRAQLGDVLNHLGDVVESAIGHRRLRSTPKVHDAA